MIVASGFLLLLLLSAGQTAAQNPAPISPPSIETAGEAKVVAQPDRAQIDLGVVTQANSSQAAADQNARKLDATITSLRPLLGTDGDIKTISYALQPNYRYPKEGGEPEITGYTATNTVRITLDDLGKVGTVIDTATRAGANRVSNLQFTLRNQREVQKRALREAAAVARSKANALASSLGLSIVRVLSVVETSPAAVPVRDIAFARAETAATPIEPGTIEVRATVKVRLEVSQ